MRGLWMAGPSLLLSAWAAAAPAQEGPWRPVAPTGPTPIASTPAYAPAYAPAPAGAASAVSLGRPTPAAGAHACLRPGRRAATASSGWAPTPAGAMC